MLQRLSPRFELILVNLICFGPFAATSIAGALARETTLLYDDRRVYTIVGIELVAGTLAALFLRARGWKLSDLGLKFSMPMTIAGMLLFIGANVAIALFNEAFRAVTGIDAAAATTPVIRVSWLPFILFLLIDPLYEETFEVAYNLRATERDGAFFAISLSAAIRLVCHLYQGPIAPLTILPLGIIFGIVYWKTRRIWPVVVAHAMAGWFAFSPMEVG